MAQRTVRVGVMTYTQEGGLLQFALWGSVVNVADDDLERFDRLNGPEPEVEDQSGEPEPEVDGDPQDDGETGESDDGPGSEPDGKAPRGNASREAWAVYATTLGIAVPDDAKQGDIKALVAAAQQ